MFRVLQQIHIHIHSGIQVPFAVWTEIRRTFHIHIGSQLYPGTQVQFAVDIKIQLFVVVTAIVHRIQLTRQGFNLVRSGIDGTSVHHLFIIGFHCHSGTHFKRHVFPDPASVVQIQTPVQQELTEIPF